MTVDKENPNTNYNGDDLEIGSPDGTEGTEKRVIVSFNVDQAGLGSNFVIFIDRHLIDDSVKREISPNYLPKHDFNHACFQISTI